MARKQTEEYLNQINEFNEKIKDMAGLNKNEINELLDLVNEVDIESNEINVDKNEIIEKIENINENFIFVENILKTLKFFLPEQKLTLKKVENIDGYSFTVKFNKKELDNTGNFFNIIIHNKYTNTEFNFIIEEKLASLIVELSLGQKFEIKTIEENKKEEYLDALKVILLDRFNAFLEEMLRIEYKSKIKNLKEIFDVYVYVQTGYIEEINLMMFNIYEYKIEEKNNKFESYIFFKINNKAENTNIEEIKKIIMSSTVAGTLKNPYLKIKKKDLEKLKLLLNLKDI